VLLLVGIAAWQLGQAAYIYAKALLAQHLLQTAWARTLNGATTVRPWPWADTWPMARLRVPSRGLDLIILAGASGRTMAFGPGHISGSATPGAPGNAIISAHRDTHFRFLRDFRVGERIHLQTGDGVWRVCQVVGTCITDTRKGTVVPDCGVSCLTLVTCYPFDAVLPATAALPS